MQPEIERHLRKIRKREKLLVAVVRYQVLNIGARNRAGQEKRVRHAASRKYRSIARVKTPATGQLNEIRPRAEDIATADVSEVGSAVVTYPILQLCRAAGGRGEIGMLERATQVDNLELTDGIAEFESCQSRLGGEGGIRRCQAADIRIGHIERATDTIHGEVGVGVGNAVDLAVASRIQVEREAVSGSDHIRVNEASIEHEALGFPVPDAAADFGG